MVRGITFLAGAMLALALAGCVPAQKVVSPRVELQNVKILQAEGLMQRLEVQLLVSNPNDFDIPLTGLDFALRLNDLDFGTGLSNTRVDIPRLGQAVVPVEIRVSLFSVFQQIQALQNRTSLDYGIAGTVYLDHLLLGNVPFERKGSMSLQDGKAFVPL